MASSTSGILAAWQPRLRRALAEPLVQFALIGLVIFAVDRATTAPEIDPRTIVIDETVQRELVGLYQTRHGVLPTHDKLEELIEVYTMNEALYREARELRLDEGDEMMRERMMTRLRMMLLSGTAPPPPDDETLRAWFDERQDDYRVPALVSMAVVGLDATEAEAMAVAEALNADEAAARRRFPNFLVLTERPLDQLEHIMGEPFVRAVTAQPAGTWQPVATPEGWQAARFDALVEGRAADFEEIVDGVRKDWEVFMIRRAAHEALDTVRARYPVERRPLVDGLVAGEETEVSGGGDEAATAGSAVN